MTEDVRFYGRRRGKALRPGRKLLMQHALPLVRVPEPGGPQDPRDLFINPQSDPAPLPLSAFDTSSLSSGDRDGVRAGTNHNRETPLWLEVGFGGGEHLAHQAAANPHVNIIGAEVFENGIASLLSQLFGTPKHADDPLTPPANVRIYPGDVRHVLPHWPDACLSRVFVLFPDPWPKARHAARRFIGPAMLPTLARLLQDGGVLRVASDVPGYVSWTLRHVLDHGAFAWTARSPAHWQERPADAIPTRYETKALREGRVPAYLSFHRRPRAEGA